ILASSMNTARLHLVLGSVPVASSDPGRCDRNSPEQRSGPPSSIHSFAGASVEPLGDDLLGVDAHTLALLAVALEAHIAVDLGEERVVLAESYIHARMELGPPLANEDAACAHLFTGMTLHTQALRLAVAPVARAAHSLLVGEKLQIDAN